MSEKILNNTFRPTKEDSVILQKIHFLEPKTAESSGAAYRYAFNNACNKNFSFREAAQYRPRNMGSIDVNPVEYGSSTSYSIKESVWKEVVEKCKSQLNLEKVRISYLTRLVLKGYLMELEREHTSNEPEQRVKVNTKSIDGVNLLQKVLNHTAELIKSGDIETILKFLKLEENEYDL